jgi:glutaredoxin/glutathione-dependent peroxiredoxin
MAVAEESKTIAEGSKLPSATLLRMGAEGPEKVELGPLLQGRRVVIFAVPGAFTPTCHSAHMPSFVRTKPQFDASGIDDVICIAVNDPHVLRAWGEVTGATQAGIRILADAEGTFTRAIGMDFDAPAAGLVGRSQRYAMVVEDGVVRTLHRESARGVCEATAGESLLATL